MISTVYKPGEIKRGLHASFINDHNDYFLMTSFDIRFAVPNKDEPIDDKTMYSLERLFAQYLVHNNLRNKIIHLGQLKNSGISLNLSNYYSKDAALELIKNACEYIIKIEKGEPSENEAIAKIQLGFDQAKELIKEFLKDITEGGLYEYEEEYM